MTGYKKKPIRLVLIEPNLTGHHLEYLVHFLQLMLRTESAEVFLYVSDPAIIERELIIDGNRSQENLSLQRIHPAVVKVLRQIEQKRYLKLVVPLLRILLYRNILKRFQKSNAVFFSFYLDEFWPYIAILREPFGLQFTGTFMRTRFHWSKMGVLAPKRRGEGINCVLFRWFLSRAKLTSFTFDPTLVSYVKENWVELSTKIRFLPDPNPFVETYAAYNKVDPKASNEGRNWRQILVPGRGPNKPLNSLIRAVQDNLLPQWIEIRTVGRPHAEINELFAACQQRGIRFTASEEVWIPRHDLIREFSNSGFIWLNYSPHLYASGLFSLALYSGAAPVVSQFGLLGAVVNKYELGIAVKSDLDIQMLFDKMYTNDAAPRRMHESWLISPWGASSFDSELIKLFECIR